MSWNNVKERLPESDGRYLVLRDFFDFVYHMGKRTKRHIPDCCNFFLDKGWNNPVPHLYEITHWMEIPKPPEDSDE